MSPIFLKQIKQTPSLNNNLDFSQNKRELNNNSFSKSEKIFNYETDNFIITFSQSGGYIKKIQIKPYQEEFFYQNLGLIPNEEKIEFEYKLEKNKVIFYQNDEKRKEFIFDDYLITINIFSSQKENKIIVFSNLLSSKILEQNYQEIFYKNSFLKRKNFKQFSIFKEKEIKFIGARDQYYCISLLPKNYKIETEKKDKEFIFYLLFSSPNYNFSFYLGPQNEKELGEYNLNEIIYYGFFHFFAVIIKKIIFLFYFLTKNWGVSIIFLSILIYFLLFPFTFKSIQAMKKLQEIQPQIEILKNKYKENPQKLNQEILELYKKYKLNPLGGCLPIFFQLPIFIALYQTVLRLIELKQANFLWIKNLSLPDRAIKLSFNLPFGLGEYINLLPLLMIILGIIQQLFSSQNISSDQKKIGLFFSVFIGIIFYNFPSSLVLYWFIQNILNFIFQYRLQQIKVFT